MNRRRVIYLDDSASMLSIVRECCQAIDKVASDSPALEFQGVTDWSDQLILRLNRPLTEAEEGPLLFISDYQMHAVNGDLVLRSVRKANGWINMILLSSLDVSGRIQEIEQVLEPAERKPLKFVRKDRGMTKLIPLLRAFKESATI